MSISLLPDPEKVQKTVVELQEVYWQFDALNCTLDDLIAQVDVEIQNSPLTSYRLRKSREMQVA